MKVWVQGSNAPMTLTQRHYVASGGEGSVYAIGGTAYKVYHDPKTMMPRGKIDELQEIQDPYIITPIEVIVDKQGMPVGYSALFVRDAWALTQLFPRIFHKRHSLTPEKIISIVEKLRTRFANVHQASVLLVDANEMNFLVSQSFDEVYGIDSGSYQTSHYPTTAIMSSVRDWSVNGNDWSDLSDWYSFGILAFQLFTGIHPFKGRYMGPDKSLHGHLPTDDPDDAFAVTRRRMLANVSVFNPEVRVPRAATPVDTIPVSYRDWFEQVFEHGERLPPPGEMGAVVLVTPATKTVTGTDNLDIRELMNLDGVVASLWSDGSKIVAITDKSVWLDGRPTCVPDDVVGVAFVPRSSRPVLVTHRAGEVPGFTDLNTGREIPFQLSVEDAVVHDGRVYLRTHEHVHEVILTDMGGQVAATSRVAVNVLPHATRLYPGVVVQNMLGSVYVSLLTKAGSAPQVRLEELDGYRLIEAKYECGVLMTVSGQYDRMVFRFDEQAKYDLRVVEGIQPTGLNFVVLDSGVTVCLTEDDKLEVFKARKGSSHITTIEDDVLGGDMVLSKRGGQVVFSRGSKVYRMGMK